MLTMRVKAALLCIALLAGCAGRHAETARYESDELPAWILDEWARAQDELLELDDLPDDPRRFSASNWSWVQLDQVFSWTNSKGERKRLRGLTQYGPRQIVICCGDRETLRHEVFHAILFDMRDPRHAEHYPDLRP